MRRFSVMLLLLLGVVVVVVGVLDLLREAQIIVFNFTGFDSVFIIVLGLWIVACVVECRRELGA